VASVTYGYLPAILRRFRKEYPEVELKLTELWGVEQSQALKERRIQVGLSRLPQPEEDLLIETLAHEPVLAALPASHPLSMRDSIRFGGLSEEGFIFYPPPERSNYSAFLSRLCESAGFHPRVSQWTEEMETALSLVAAGLGITLVPASLVGLQREGVVYRAIADPSPEIDLTVAYRKSDTSPVLPHFLRITRETVARLQADSVRE
jgi:DNA-binding transcriptional LysR family regulator